MARGEINEGGGRSGVPGQSERGGDSAVPQVASGTVAAPRPGAASPRALLPSITLPKGGGAIRGIGEKFSTNSATGTVSLSIPIATSPGRSGFELSLELAYDSGAGNGPFGIGWQLSTPTVTRKTDKGLPRYRDSEESDVFILSGAEDLVPVRISNGGSTRLDAFDRIIDNHTFRVQRYRPRIEGLFARIERWTRKDTGDVHWRAITRENVTNVYGKSAQAQIVDPENSRRVFSWLLEETSDDRGNIARYTYKAEDGTGVSPKKLSEASRFDLQANDTRVFRATAQRYLKRIEYGNRVPSRSTQWLFEVVFDYGEHHATNPIPDDSPPWSVRLDPFSTYRSGFEVRTYRLCRRVLMFHRFEELGETPCLVRSTDFTYQESPVVTYLTKAIQAGYKRDSSGNYERAEFPPLEFSYIQPKLHHEVQSINRDSLDGIPGGVGHGDSQWVDLDGEGIPGVLTTTPRAWVYKSNLGEGRLAAPSLLRTLPAPAKIGVGVRQLRDLAGDGLLDLVQYAPPLQGYFTRTPDGEWQTFKNFKQLPNIGWDNPNLRFVDLNGDGHPDVLITEHEVFTWYQSRGKEGFDPATQIRKPRDEREGPAVVFSDGTESVHLADVSGDGLTDIVRVRNGEVCYWPNLGYGRFGRQVILEHSPRFDTPEQFDPKRIRFADIDGSGTSDIIYLGRKGAGIYLNESGNALSKQTLVDSLPLADGLSTIEVVDLLGQGTACLVWSSPLPGESSRPIRYVDLMGGKKPHLIESVKNNLGGETRISYAPSTRYYLDDKAEGRPWLTRLPFPVQVIECIERVDHIAKSKLVTYFRYHHGFFDGHEREFRGFACVEQWDAESFGEDRGRGLFPELAYNVDSGENDLNLPPVRTVTWFHTGAWLERERLEVALLKEYYGKDQMAPQLADTILPSGLSVQEEREAARALRGRVLRQEIYTEDHTADRIHPFSVSEQNYETQLLQPAEGQRHAVIFVHPHETIDLHYERNPADPRIQHELVLKVDDFGNVTQSATIAYPRRNPVQPEQRRPLATFTDQEFINRPNETKWYRIGVPCQITTSELTGLTVQSGEVLSATDVRNAITSATKIDYEDTADRVNVQKRVIEQEQTLYWSNDQSAVLSLSQIESLALPCETYRQALTPGLVTQVYWNRVDRDILLGEGRYLDRDNVWWAPSGQVKYDADRFYLPNTFTDPFGSTYWVVYDDYSLLPRKTFDPHDNVTQSLLNKDAVRVALLEASGEYSGDEVDEAEQEHLELVAESSYRVLSPTVLIDPNDNWTAAEFDPLGMVIKGALMGKVTLGEGDTLADPTTRFKYDLSQFKDQGRPNFVHALAREKHGDTNPRWQETYTYSDGSGREVMKKVQAEPGPIPCLDIQEDVNPRWVGTGRTVFDNKGNPVKKYEPFFSNTFHYENEKVLVECGVTPILRYDPLGRLIRTDLPNGTHTKVVFDAWKQEHWDENDTIEGTLWHLEVMRNGTPEERRAATLALAHKETPGISHLDVLGRVFLSIADNGGGRKYETHIMLDIEGNQRAVTDARGVKVLAQKFDMLGQVIEIDSADAGKRTTIFDVAGKPVRTWDPRRNASRSMYDTLQRQTHLFVKNDHGQEKLVERVIYGEGHGTAKHENLGGQVFQMYDGAGAVTNMRYDFKGNLLVTTRQLAKTYRETMDWSRLNALIDINQIQTAAANALENDTYTTTTRYDALDRVVSRTTPDGKETRPFYNEANLLEKIEMRIRGFDVWTSLVHNIDYNARGQRTKIQYGNNSTTNYTYDPLTFRLDSQVTSRVLNIGNLQDLKYTYDPVGNIVQISVPVSYGNSGISANGLYEYDALYQLTKAEGREHPGQQPTHEDPPLLRTDHQNDMQGLKRYCEQYAYDEVGNILSMRHQSLPQNGVSWHRRYRYAADSNRLLRTSAPSDQPGMLLAIYKHDEAGNMIRMPHLPEMRWDHADRLQSTSKQVVSSGTPETTYYTYDASGQRVRKVTERHATANLIPVRMSERIYLDGFEIFREYKANGTSKKLERETLHVMDDERRIALLETKTHDSSIENFEPSIRVRFQLNTHLSSSVLELDWEAKVISYEEYFPYGGTSFHAAHSAAEVSRKRYRYTGKERDEETGLYYHEARYYAAWLGRWTSADPLIFQFSIDQGQHQRQQEGSVITDPSRGKEISGSRRSSRLLSTMPLVPSMDSAVDQKVWRGEAKSGNLMEPLNSFAVVRNNPIRFNDPTGLQGDDTVGEPGKWEGMIPVWGSGRSAVQHFQKGELGWGLLHTGFAVTDVFIAKTLVTLGGKLFFKGATKSVATEMAEKTLVRDGPKTLAKETAHDVVEKTTAKELTKVSAGGFGQLSRAAEFGIKPYGTLQKSLKGTGLQAHHLIEQRFAALMGQKKSKMLSVAVTHGRGSEHQLFTNAWRKLIPWGEGTANATKEQVLRAAKLIYADFPHILKALGL